MSARRTNDANLFPVRSASVAAHLVMRGHGVQRIGREHDRDTFYFDPAARPDFTRLMLEVDALRAESERAAEGARR